MVQSDQMFAKGVGQRLERGGQSGAAGTGVERLPHQR
jgi:hypothetical protein